jgi:hypothetical protein
LNEKTTPFAPINWIENVTNDKGVNAMNAVKSLRNAAICGLSAAGWLWLFFGHWQLACFAFLTATVLELTKR